jgi:hypothetical protein
MGNSNDIRTKCINAQHQFHEVRLASTGCLRAYAHHYLSSRVLGHGTWRLGRTESAMKESNPKQRKASAQ